MAIVALLAAAIVRARAGATEHASPSAPSAPSPASSDREGRRTVGRATATAIAVEVRSICDRLERDDRYSERTRNRVRTLLSEARVARRRILAGELDVGAATARALIGAEMEFTTLLLLYESQDLDITSARRKAQELRERLDVAIREDAARG